MRIKDIDKWSVYAVLMNGNKELGDIKVDSWNNNDYWYVDSDIVLGRLEYNKGINPFGTLSPNEHIEYILFAEKDGADVDIYSIEDLY